MSEEATQALGFELYRVVAPRFVAGLICRPDGRIVRAAPILRRLLREGCLEPVRAICERRRWKLEGPIAAAPGR